jgi:hypothetical protein
MGGPDYLSIPDSRRVHRQGDGDARPAERRRVILDACAGWMKEEFDVFGVPFERRGERMDEYIKALACCGATRSRRSKMSSSTPPTFG